MGLDRAPVPSTRPKPTRQTAPGPRAALLFGLAYLMWNTGAEFAVTGETTAQLKITKAPFIQGMGVLCGLTGLVHLTKAFWPGEEESSEGGTL